MKNIDIDAALAATRQVKTATEALHKSKADLTSKKTALEEANQAIYRQPLLQKEILQLMKARIDALAALFPRTAKWDQMFSDFVFPKGLRPSRQGPMAMNPIYFVGSPAPISLQDVQVLRAPDGNFGTVLQSENLSNFFRPPGESSAVETQRACFYFGDLIKAKLESHFNNSFKEIANKSRIALDGLSIEEKREVINGNDEKIISLEQQLSDVDAQLQALADAGASTGKVGGVQ